MVHIDAETRSFCTAVDSIEKPVPLLDAPNGIDFGAAQENHTEHQDAITSVDLDGAGDSLGRTASQQQKQIQVHEVLGRLIEYQQPVEDLMKTVSQLVAELSQDVACFEDAKSKVESLRKSAHNHGEDLLEYTLALDRLTGLFHEDRASRKTAIAGLDALLEKIDVVKANLALLEKDLSNTLAVPNELKSCLSPESTQINNQAGEDPMDIDHAVEEDIMINTQVEEVPECESSVELNRTGSQIRTQAQLQNVVQRWEDKNNPVQRLKAKVLRLVARTSKDSAQLEEEKMVLEDSQKLARNLGEDLFEDIVALDELSGLFVEDRCHRKTIIARLEGFLEEVDKIKSDLSKLKADLNARLDIQRAGKKEQSDLFAESQEKALHLRGTAGTKSGQQADQQSPAKSRKCVCNECGSASTEGRMGDSGFEDQWFCSDCWRAWEGSSVEKKSEPPAQTWAVENLCSLAVPERKFWEHLELPLYFEASEGTSYYTVTSRPCNLRPEEVTVQLSRDKSHLMISGTHLPTTAELTRMQHELQQHASQYDCNSLSLQALPTLYAKMAQGYFGSFSKSFELPRDIDVTRLEASCDKGSLCIKLPKRRLRARSKLNHSFLW